MSPAIFAPLPKPEPAENEASAARNQRCPRCNATASRHASKGSLSLLHAPDGCPLPSEPWTATRSADVNIDMPAAGSFSALSLAHALARINRFGGAYVGVEQFSVAEHSVRAALLAEYLGMPWATMMKALLHDAHEVVIGDISNPMKRWLNKEYHAKEGLERLADRIDWRIAGDLISDSRAVLSLLGSHVEQDVARIDNWLLYAEASVVMPRGTEGWPPPSHNLVLPEGPTDFLPADGDIGWPVARAESLWNAHFAYLMLRMPDFYAGSMAVGEIKIKEAVDLYSRLPAKPPLLSAQETSPHAF